MKDQLEHYAAFTAATGSTSAQAEVISEQPNSRTLEGYAVVWGATSDVRADGYRHRFTRGSIVWAPVVNALWSHDRSQPIGSTRNQTLTITEDDIGVKVRIGELPQTSTANDVLELVRTKLVQGMSFGGRRQIDDYRPTADPQVIDITLFAADEVTVSLDPAMEETSIVIAGTDEAENLTKLMKDNQRREAKHKLDKIKLSLTRPGTVSGRPNERKPR